MPHFVDTNIVVYSVVGGVKAPRALDVLRDAIISVQVLNELTNVGLRKLQYDRFAIQRLVAEVCSQVSSVRPIDLETHDLARDIAFRYKLGFYDSLLLAAALLADCEIFYSEDLHHGLLIEDTLRVINPFV